MPYSHGRQAISKITPTLGGRKAPPSFFKIYLVGNQLFGMRKAFLAIIISIILVPTVLAIPYKAVSSCIEDPLFSSCLSRQIIGCTQIYQDGGGGDTDFCNDAGGGGGGSSPLFTEGSFLKINHSATAAISIDLNDSNSEIRADQGEFNLLNVTTASSDILGSGTGPVVFNNTQSGSRLIATFENSGGKIQVGKVAGTIGFFSYGDLFFSTSGLTQYIQIIDGGQTNYNTNTFHNFMDDIKVNGNASITNAADSNALYIDQNGNSPTSTSTGGALRLDCTGNNGACQIIYSNAGSSATGRLFNIRADNPDFAQAAFHIDYDGTANALEVVYNGIDTTGQAFNVVSNNPADSAFTVTSNATDRGVAKIVHKANESTTGSASAISIQLEGENTPTQGVYIDKINWGTGNFITFRNASTDVFIIDYGGGITMNWNITGTSNSFIRQFRGINTLSSSSFFFDIINSGTFYFRDSTAGTQLKINNTAVSIEDLLTVTAKSSFRANATIEKALCLNTGCTSYIFNNGTDSLWI